MDVGETAKRSPPLKEDAMLDNEYRQEAQINFQQEDQSAERRSEDRRKEPSQGFAYIGPVGWICRREKLRRDDDSGCF